MQYGIENYWLSKGKDFQERSYAKQEGRCNTDLLIPLPLKPQNNRKQGVPFRTPW